MSRIEFVVHVICVNLNHPSVFIFGLLLLFWCFSVRKLLFNLVKFLKTFVLLTPLWFLNISLQFSAVLNHPLYSKYLLITTRNKFHRYLSVYRLDDATLPKGSKKSVTEELQLDDDFSQMPLDKTRAKYLYPERQFSYLYMKLTQRLALCV